MRMVYLLVLLTAGQVVLAEMRTWTDREGKKVQAAFRRELFGDLQLVDERGQTFEVRLEDLSDEDREHVKKNIPPGIESTVRWNSERRPELDWTIAGDRTDLYTFTVRLRKTTQLPYTGTLTAELFVLAEENDGDNYIVMHREVQEFVFPDERRAVFEFKVEDVPFRTYISGWAREAATTRGQSYFGYVIAVSDAEDQLIFAEANRRVSWLTNDMERTVRGLRRIAIDGRGSIFSRHFNTQFRKTQTPRVPWHRRDAFF